MADIMEACDTTERVWKKRLESAVAAERERCASKLVAYIAEHGGTIELRAVVDAIREGE